MIPRETLERWRALADAATPGPWYAPDDGDHVVDGNGDYLMTDNNVLCPERADFKFTAAAREAVPALISEIERLRTALTSASTEQCELRWRGKLNATCLEFYAERRELWCASCIARSALKEDI